MKSIIATTAIFAALCFAQTTFAWNSTGHEIIADLAYRQLNADVRKKVDDLMKEHPKYETWVEAAEEAADDRDPSQIGRLVFAQAATYPDLIRNPKDPSTHPNWHFVDYPYHGKDPLESFERPSPNEDILVGLKSSENTIRSESASKEKKAVALSWIQHLVGDCHQPLHCVTLFTAELPPPDGDRGGNKVFIRPAKAGIKLHSFWDGLLGDGKLASNLIEIENRTVVLRQTHKPEEFKPAALAASPMDWSRESYILAVKKAYLSGKLDLKLTQGEAVKTPKDYSKNAQKVAESQAALAAYRLARLVENLFAN